jgi:hypothetical protein
MKYRKAAYRTETVMALWAMTTNHGVIPKLVKRTNKLYTMDRCTTGCNVTLLHNYAPVSQKTRG